MGWVCAQDYLHELSFKWSQAAANIVQLLPSLASFPGWPRNEATNSPFLYCDGTTFPLWKMVFDPAYKNNTSSTVHCVRGLGAMKTTYIPESTICTCSSFSAYRDSLVTNSTRWSVSRIRSPCREKRGGLGQFLWRKNGSMLLPLWTQQSLLTLFSGPSVGSLTTTSPSLRELTQIFWISSNKKCSFSFKLLTSSK